MMPLRGSMVRRWKVLLGFAAAVVLLPIVLQSYTTASEIWIYGLPKGERTIRPITK